MIEIEMLEMLESTIELTPVTALRRDGRPTLGKPVQVQAHIEPKSMTLKNAAGDETDVNGVIYCDDVYPWVDEETRLVLPIEGTQIIVAVEVTYGFNLDTGLSGPYQTVIYF